MPTSKTKGPDSPPQRSRRSKKVPPGQPRARPIHSCLTCRDRKKGCDKRQPKCGNCMLNPDPNTLCLYAHGKTEVLKAHKEKMQSLKEAFATSVASTTAYDSSKFEEIGNPILDPLLAKESAFKADVADENADIDIHWGILLSGERAQPSASSSSSYTSMKPWEASQTSLRRNLPDDQLAGIASPYASPEIFEQISGSDPNEVTMFTNVRQQNNQFSQGQLRDLDMVSLKQHFPDIGDTNSQMSPETIYRTSMEHEYLAHVSLQSQSPMQWKTTNDCDYSAPPSHTSSVPLPSEYEDRSAERHPYDPMDARERSETYSNYATTAIASFPMTSFTHLSIPPTGSSAMFTSQFPPVSSMQSLDNIPRMQPQQQTHQHHLQNPLTLNIPFSDLNIHAFSKHNTWYSNATLSSHQGAFNTRGGHGSYVQQPNSTANDIQEYHSMDEQRY